MSEIDPVVAMHRANQAFQGQITQTAVLECGTAYFSAEFGAMANQVRDVVLPDGWTVERAYEQVRGFFSRLSHPCRIWSPALDQPPEVFELFLEEHDYAVVRRGVYALRPWPEPKKRAGVRVVPGRAVREALSELTLNDPGRGSLEGRRLNTGALLARFDDPQFEVFVALAGREAVGHACLLQVGPVAAIYDVYVREAHRNRGVASTLVSDIISTCRRLELRTVVLEVREGNDPAIALYERCGFERVGRSVDYMLRGRSA